MERKKSKNKYACVIDMLRATFLISKCQVKKMRKQEKVRSNLFIRNMVTYIVKLLKKKKIFVDGESIFILREKQNRSNISWKFPT